MSRLIKYAIAALLLIGAPLLLWAMDRSEASEKETTPRLVTADKDHEPARVMKFYSPYCPSCKRMEPLLSQLATQCDHADVFVEAIDVSAEANETFIDQYDVGAVPTLVFVDSNGVETTRLVGIQSASRCAIQARASPLRIYPTSGSAFTVADLLREEKRAARGWV